VDRSRLYLVQLAEWALAEDLPDRVLSPEARPQLMGALTSLAYRPAVDVMKFLTADPDKATDPLDHLAQLEQLVSQAKSPQEAGAAALEWIAERFQRVTPSMQAAQPL